MRSAQADNSENRFLNSPVLMVMVLILIALAFLLGRATDGPRRNPTPTTSPSPGAPTGSEVSAVSAATKFSRVMTGPSGDVPEYLMQVKSIAAPSWQSRAQELANNSIQFVRHRYG